MNSDIDTEKPASKCLTFHTICAEILSESFFTVKVLSTILELYLHGSNVERIPLLVQIEGSVIQLPTRELTHMI
jgi:hypothetical protein